MGGFEILAVEYDRRPVPESNILLLEGGSAERVMSFSFWVIRDETHTVVVDTGYTVESAAKRQRKPYREVSGGLSLAGVDPGQVKHVIITHFHWDHTGNLKLFPKATFHVQQREMAFWTGNQGGSPFFARCMEPDDLIEAVRLNFEGRLRQVSEDVEVLPGITAKHVGGHTPGHQIVVITDGSRTVVLASDAVKFYENMEKRIPDPFSIDISGALRAFETIREMEAGGAVIVAGHDPLVSERFEETGPGLVRI